MVYHFLFQVHVICRLAKRSCHRTPALLQTCRLVYFEAISVLYEQVKVMVTPGDLIGIRNCCATAFPLIRDLWRYNPLDDYGLDPASGKWVYHTPERKGKMYPHVFNRFQRIEVLAHLNFFWPAESSAAEFAFDIYDGDEIDGDFPDVEKARLLAYLRRSRLFQLLVKFLSRVSTIRTLEIGVDVRPEISRIRRSRAFPETDFLANVRSTEIFMTSGSMEPLRGLENVQLLRFRLDVGHVPIQMWEARRCGIEEGSSCEERVRSLYRYMPQYLELTGSIVRDVERNWARRRGEDPGTAVGNVR